MEKPKRRHDLDWLRVLLILSVFLYHCARFFTQWDWHVKDSVVSPGMVVFTQFFEMWILPAIFIVSGASIWYSLGYQKSGRLIKGKVLRLLVPLVFGAFVLSPHQVYLERLTHGQFVGSFINWFPRYFNGLYGLGGNFAFHGLHLWYLMLLFFFTLILLPLFQVLRSEKGMTVIRAVGSFLRIPGTIYILGLLLTIPMAYIDENSFFGMRVWAGWNIVYYIIIFFFGFLIFSDERIQEAIVRVRYISLIAGIILLITFRLGITVLSSPLKPGLYNYVISSWCFILAILGFGMMHLTSTGRFLGYATEAVLPFYMLHQAVIVLIGFWIIRLQIPVLAKYVIITLLSFIAIMVSYEVIRRVGVLRFLFGMKVRKSTAKI